MQKKSDAELMQLIKEKHRPALEEIYDRYIKIVFSFSLKATKDTEKAKVIIQAVFLRIWTTENVYNSEKGQFVNWLLTITRNIIIDHHRKEKKEQSIVAIGQEQLEQLPEHSSNNPAEILSKKLFREQIEQAYQYLSNNQIELIQWLYWEGYTLREIAEMKQEPIGTIKSRLHQTLKILRNRMEPEIGGMKK
ncbi:sigma-70 family RNA polymerase sigma factor [Bacillus sp. RG28]|uniref:Sigma-70 family RNA polymerase sigma factor n=1 Tax=Gottfriedia endophytica TaxID=2820819 RepID=A0A940NFR3_9BACI|nr:sigma-70 family RNA polymerase sigma factor [Gottfriedia endophytica]MBP0724629.1 sigma-70 family RNA polymerase sigma factor [Gottfriedia endophytica]